MTGMSQSARKRRTIAPFLKTVLPIFFLVPWIMGASSGCPNYYTTFAQTNTDSALLFAAQQKINSKDYTSAISTIGLMTAVGQSSHDATVLLSVAYVGRCGLDMLGLATVIANMGSTTLFNTLETYFASASAANKSDCDAADTLMSGLPASELSADDNVFFAFVELAKIGATLVTSGATTASYTCATLSDTDTAQIGSGLTIAYNELLASGSPTAASLVAEMKTLCTAIAGAPANDATLCTTTNPASFTANELNVFRTLVAANEIGVDSCGGSSYSGGGCTCP